MTFLVFFIELFSIIFTNFNFDLIGKHTTKQLIIACVFAVIMIPAFNRVNMGILNETISEAKLSYLERDSYK